LEPGKKSTWKVHEACAPYQMDRPWQDIGTATTEQKAVALAQAHNDHA
jgi:hypothetical protein